MTIRTDIAALTPLRIMTTARGEVDVIREVKCVTCESMALICRGKRDLYIRCMNGCGTSFNAALKVQQAWYKQAVLELQKPQAVIQKTVEQAPNTISEPQAKNLLQWLLNLQIVAP